MNYQWHYDRLIETRKKRECADEYYEKHHIVMKSMGGSDDESNLVLLTPREHFLAHWLLWRIHRNRSTAFAFNTFCKMFTGRNHLKRSLKISSRGYQEAREAYSITQKEKMSGVLNSNRSRIVLQYDLNENFIKEWPSAKEAYRQLKISHITACCREERKSAGGFIWKYKTPVFKKSKKYEKRKTNEVRNKRPVLQFNLLGEQIAEFNSLSEAQQKTGIPRASIQSNIAGLLKHAGKHIWKYKN